MTDAETDLVAPHPAEQLPDWEQVARAALANGASKGMRKVNRRNLTALCQDLADGTPLDTAARKLGIEPHNVRAWADLRPVVWRAIEQARAQGEYNALQGIKQATDWKAAAYRLGLMRPEYKEGVGNALGGGPAIQVVINVPTPQLVEPGARPMIDITPAAHTQPVDSAPAPVIDKPAK